MYPSEEAALMAATDIPVVRRLFSGYCATEGVRRENAVTIEWNNLVFDLPGGVGCIVLDTSKNGRGGNWKLDPGTAEALRCWKSICPSNRFVTLVLARGETEYWVLTRTGHRSSAMIANRRHIVGSLDCHDQEPLTPSSTTSAIPT